MNELIKVNYENPEQATVSGRDLHRALEVETPYRKWFPRMCEYGFEEIKDFKTDKNVRVQIEGEREVIRNITDHQLSISMAKEICMLQRSEKGKMFRQYFIEVEEAWNKPEAVMARALQIAQNTVDKLKLENKIQAQQIEELTPKSTYYDLVLNCKDLISISVIAKDYGKSAQWMNQKLHDLKIQYRQGNIWLLYQEYADKGYTSTKTQSYAGNDGELHTKVHTYWTQKGRLFIYELLKNEGILPLIEREEDEERTNEHSRCN